MKYIVEVTWEVLSYHVIEANSILEARILIGDKLDQCEITLPSVDTDNVTNEISHIKEIDEEDEAGG